MKRREAVLDIYNAVLGAFLFISPWLFAYSFGPARDASFATGALLVLISVLAIAMFSEWEEWINLGIGCWIIASPWVLEFPHHRSAMHVAVGVGAVVVFLALLELFLLHNPGWVEPQHQLPPQRGEPLT